MEKASRGKGKAFIKYQSRFWRDFYKESAAWARDNIFWGAVVLVIPPLAALIRNKATASSPDWETVKLTLWL
jgi:hypothetical protein